MSTNETESSLDPDEPHTPAWFTFLGIGLFLLGGIFLLASQDNDAEDAVPSEEAAPSEEPLEVQKGDAAGQGVKPAPTGHEGHGH